MPDVKTRPILFSAALVRAILDGSKTVTRRVVMPTTEPKLPPQHMEPWIPVVEQAQDEDGRRLWSGTHPEYPTADGKWFSCPYGAVGDRLWVQEGYRVEAFDVIDNRLVTLHGAYLADGTPFSVELDARESALFLNRKNKIASTPGRFMYRSIARTALEVTEVSVERLNDLTDVEAIDEGVLCDTVEFDGSRTPRDEFRELWDRINAHRGFAWDVDPYVWRVAFGRTV